MASKYDGKTWSDLADECDAKGIEVDTGDDADTLRKKLNPKSKPKPVEGD